MATAAGAPPVPPGVLRHAFQAMGSPCEVHLEADTPALAALAVAAAEAEVRRLEARYSRYRDDSVLSAINRSAGGGRALKVDAETAALLDYAQIAWERSGGLFDISTGALRGVWDFKAGRVPAAQDVERAMAQVGWHRVRWRKPWIELPAAGMALDFGGCVKEYAADRAAAIVRSMGVRHGLVELGGDIALVGPHADGTPWTLGIRDPRAPSRAPSRAVATLTLATGALASSGDYERCFIQDGRRYSHLLDPRTGRPVEDGLAAVSVAGAQCLVAGTATTIAMLSGVHDGLRWLKALGLPYLAVDGHGQVHRGAGGS